jgi:hypothetical protein
MKQRQDGAQGPHRSLQGPPPYEPPARSLHTGDQRIASRPIPMWPRLPPWHRAASVHTIGYGR